MASAEPPQPVVVDKEVKAGVLFENTLHLRGLDKKRKGLNRACMQTTDKCSQKVRINRRTNTLTLISKEDTRDSISASLKHSIRRPSKLKLISVLLPFVILKAKLVPAEFQLKGKYFGCVSWKPLTC